MAAQGTLRGNDISNNRTYAVVALHGGAPALRRNWLHGARQGGVLVDEGGGVDVEDNEIAANAKSGIMLRGSSDGARLRRNRIRDGRAACAPCSCVRVVVLRRRNDVCC